MADEESLAFWGDMTPAEMKQAYDAYELFNTLTEKVRLHRRFMIKDAVFATKSRSFTDLDPRALNFMLDYLAEDERRFVDELKRRSEVPAKTKPLNAKKNLRKPSGRG